MTDSIVSVRGGVSRDTDFVVPRSNRAGLRARGSWSRESSTSRPRTRLPPTPKRTRSMAVIDASLRSSRSRKTGLSEPLRATGVARSSGRRRENRCVVPSTGSVRLLD